MSYLQVTAYPERVTMAVMRTKRNMMVLNTIKVMVGLARGPKELAML